MEFIKWIILIISFVLTDSTPTNELPSENANFTNEFNKRIASILKNNQPYWNGSYVPRNADKIKEFQKKSNDEMLLNVTTEFLFLREHPMKIEFPSAEGNSLKMSGQFLSLFVEGYLRDSNRHIVTEKITLNYSLRSTVWDEVILEYIDFDPNEIKLISSDYQFKPNEEIQFKKAVETHIRATIRQYIKGSVWRWNLIRRSTLITFHNLWHNTQERYYFIGTIPSGKYTLTNVTINGLWNARSISLDSNVLPKIEMGGVRGSVVQNCAKSSKKLSFKADKIYISMDQNIAKVNVKAKGYSVVNAKLNTTLTYDRAKSIIGDIESAIAASLQSVLQSTEASSYYEREICQSSNVQPFTELNCTNKLNKGVVAILQPNSSVSTDNRGKRFEEKSTNGMMYNVTVEFSPRNMKIELPHNDSDSIRISFEFLSVVLDGYLSGSNHRIVTEGFTTNQVLKFTMWEEFSFEGLNFGQNEIKILAGGYQYKPDEESQLKNEIETQIKENLGLNGNSEEYIRNFKCELLKFIYHFWHNNQECYYFIGTIRSTNYSLNNVTVNGLWNINSIVFDAFNGKASPEIEMGHVKGYMVRNFLSTSEELIFKADNIYISLNANTAKMNVRMKKYTVVNAKLNTTLAGDESKVIIREIESAFVASLTDDWKSSLNKKNEY